MTDLQFTLFLIYNGFLGTLAFATIIIVSDRVCKAWEKTSDKTFKQEES